MGLNNLPDKIGPYKIECLLKSGGMNLIYLGTDPVTKAPVIIKSLLSKYLLQNEAVERFSREAEIIALADHPNIVKMYGHGDWEGGHFIAMEFIMGISLRQYILQYPISQIKALEIVLDVAYALCHLHSHGIIHRDLKPENILVAENGSIKVIDFGIAQLLDDNKIAQEHEGKRTLGTPTYMSPEQRENPEAVTYPSDIYSLGIIAYELALGRLSYGQVHLSLMPRGLQKILNKALQPKPIDRYQDIVDLISDVSSYLASDNVQKERKASDRLYDFSESLKSSQKVLLPPTAPDWSGFNVGMAAQTNMEFSGAYADFLEFGNGRYAILLGEPAIAEAEGMLQSAMVRGIVRTLLRPTSKKIWTGKELVAELNALLCNNLNDSPYALCLLVLDGPQHLLHFISCGYGYLWHVTDDISAPEQIFSENRKLGTDSLSIFTEKTESWNDNDNILLLGTQNENEPLNDLIKNLILNGLIEYADMPPQTQVNALLGKIRILSSHDLNPILVKIERI